MSKMKTEQLSTKIDAGLLKSLDELNRKTHVPKNHLVEEAIRLLLQQYLTLSAVYKNGVVDQQFIAMVDDAMKKNDQTMRKLAE